jgi:hypothetical protein
MINNLSIYYYILSIEEGIINLGHTIVVFGNR